MKHDNSYESEKKKIIDEALMKNLKGGCGPNGCSMGVMADTCYDEHCNNGCEIAPLRDVCYKLIIVDC